MKLKVCGMKYNAREVAELRPDYLGFIFYGQSARYFEGALPDLPSDIQKIGVFVNATIDTIGEKIATHDLQGVQLHGNESPEFCEQLRRHWASTDGTLSAVEVQKAKKDSPNKKGKFSVIKVFSIQDDFDFSVLRHYEEVCDYFLFDTKGKLPGGNGYTFDWGVLKDYPSTKPYFLSGGIGLNEIASIKAFMQRPEARYCHALDVNSLFEIEPGLKDIQELSTFKEQLGL